MGRVKAAYYSGQYRKPAKKTRRLDNPYAKPGFWKRGSFKDTQTNRKGVIRKAYFYGRWLGWREGARGAKPRTRVPERGGTLDNAVNTKFNAGYLEGYNKGRQARKSSFNGKAHGATRTRKATKGMTPLEQALGRRLPPPKKMGKNGQEWPSKPITRGLTAEDVAKYKYGKATPQNVAAVKRNMGHLLRPETKTQRRRQ